MRGVRAWWGLVALVWLVGCGPESEPAVPAEPDPIELSWEPVEGADRYRVQLWSGYSMLMELSVNEAGLLLTEHRSRAVAAFDSVTVEVRALDATGGALWDGRWPLAR